MKTFQEIINKEIGADMFESDFLFQAIQGIMLHVMHTVRLETLKECAEKVTLTEDEIMINSLDKNSLDE